MHILIQYYINEVRRIFSEEQNFILLCNFIVRTNKLNDNVNFNYRIVCHIFTYETVASTNKSIFEMSQSLLDKSY